MLKIKVNKKEIQSLITHYEMHKGELFQKVNLMLSFTGKWEDGIQRCLHRQLKFDEMEFEQQPFQQKPEKKEEERGLMLKKLIAFRNDSVAFEKEIVSFHKSLIVTTEENDKLISSLKKKPTEETFSKAEYHIMSVYPEFHVLAEEILHKCVRFDNRFTMLIKKADKLRLRAA